MNDFEINIKVNGQDYRLRVPANMLLVEVLRDRLNLFGTKHACGTGECGACTVLMNGKSVLSCLVLACECDGAEIVTIEGLSGGDRLHPIQQAFVDKGAVQCGFCAPGMILSTKYLLDNNRDPGADDIKEGLAGNICRCTGYQKIFDAVKESAAKLREENGTI